MLYVISDFQPNEGLHGKQGGIQLARKRLELNLVTSDILESDSPEQQFNLRGWFVSIDFIALFFHFSQSIPDAEFDYDHK